MGKKAKGVHSVVQGIRRKASMGANVSVEDY